MSLRTQNSGIVENESDVKKYFLFDRNKTHILYIHFNFHMPIGKFQNYIYFIFEIAI